MVERKITAVKSGEGILSAQNYYSSSLHYYFDEIRENGAFLEDAERFLQKKKGFPFARKTLMRRRRLELPYPFEHQHLKLACLPIPPSPHVALTKAL